MRDLVVSQIHLKEVQSSGVFYVKGKERDGLFCKTSSPSYQPEGLGNDAGLKMMESETLSISLCHVILKEAFLTHPA